MDFVLMTYIERIMMCRVKVIWNYEAHSWNLSLFSKIWILRMSVYNVYGSQNKSNVSQEYSFCACAVLGKIALYDKTPYLR